MRRRNHLALALIAFSAAALLLSACGSSGGETESSPPPAASKGDSSGPAGQAAEVATGSPSKQTAEAGKKQGASRQRADSHSEASPKSVKADPKTDGANAGQQQQGQTTPKPVHIKGCPAGTSKSQCEQIGLAVQQQQSSDHHVVAKGECPAAMSQSECRQVGGVYEEAPDGQVVKPTECPRAMTAEQCAEAGKAYEEAIK